MSRRKGHETCRECGSEEFDLTTRIYTITSPALTRGFVSSTLQLAPICKRCHTPFPFYYTETFYSRKAITDEETVTDKVEEVGHVVTKLQGWNMSDKVRLPIDAVRKLRRGKPIASKKTYTRKPKHKNKRDDYNSETTGGEKNDI